MNIKEVLDKESKEDFLKVPKILYKKDPNWICPLDVEIENIFDPGNNSCFQFGEATRWILKDDKGKLIGRVAAFYDKRKMNNSYVTSGGAGFFECINDQEAANKLFDTAKEWLANKGMKAMDAPINFGENLFHWGLLVEGFQQQGIGMPYNHAYYKNLFENYGFQNYFEQYSYHKDLEKPWPERMYKFSEYLVTRPEYKFEHFSFKEKDKYLKVITDIYNQVWSEYHEDYTPLKVEEIQKLFDDTKDILDPELIWFAYHDDKPIGMVVSFPDFNQVLAKLKNGKLTLINKIKFLMNKGKINRSRVIATGVIKEYRTKGIIACLFMLLDKTVKNKNHKQLELSWTGDYNSTVLNIYDQVGAYRGKTHITYRYIFDPAVPFKRFTNEQEEKHGTTRKKKESIKEPKK